MINPTPRSARSAVTPSSRSNNRVFPQSQHCAWVARALGRTARITLTAWLVLTALVGSLRAAAPANDLCANAVQIPGSGPFPHTTAAIDIAAATLAGDPPVPSFYSNSLARSVWFRFTPAANAQYNISTCAAATGSLVVDTVMGLYTSIGGCSGPFVPLEGVEFGDENCDSQAEISTQLLADTTYYIVVWKFDDGSPDDGLNSLRLQVNGLVAPPNDRCETAVPLSLNVPALGTTDGATDHYRIDAPGAFDGIGQIPSSGPGRDVVYGFTAPASGLYSFRLWAADVTEDLLMYVAPAAACPTGTFPVLVPGVLAAANRSRVNSSEAISCLAMAAGQSVRVYVDHGVNDDPGSTFILEVTSCELAEEPNDSIGAATRLACGMEGAISPIADIDIFSLGAFPAGWRAFVLVDGEASRNSDLDLRIVSPDATLEFDDNGNDTLYGDSSPNIAGAPLPGGPAFVIVNYKGAQEAQPYRLYAVVQPPMASAQAEVEPNDATDESNTGSVNYFRGALTGAAPSTDVDTYAFNVDEGDLYIIGLDADPLRDDTPINARLELVDASGNILITANDGASLSNTNASPGTISGGNPFSPSEGLVYRFSEEGTFYARVSISPDAVGSSGAGDYLLSISRGCRPGSAFGNVTPVINAALASPTPEGQDVQLSGAVIDTDIADSIFAAVHWGDGASNVLDLATGGALNLDLNHAYAPDTTAATPTVNYQVTVFARDKSGASVTRVFPLAIQNVPPSGIILTPSATNVFPNETVTLNGVFSDPGAADAHSVSINWGDGTGAQTLNLPAGTLQFTANHSYAAGGITATISVTVTDDDQGSGTSSTSVQVLQAGARFTEIVPGPGPSFRLRLQGTSGTRYRIEKADTIGSWTELGLVTAPVSGQFEIVDTNPTASSRFYRAVVVTP